MALLRYVRLKNKKTILIDTDSVVCTVLHCAQYKIRTTLFQTKLNVHKCLCHEISSKWSVLFGID